MSKHQWAKTRYPRLFRIAVPGLCLTGIALSGCSYGSNLWNADMSIDQKAAVARAYFSEGQSQKEVEQRLNDLYVQWSRGQYTDWARSQFTPIGTCKLDAALWYKGPNFMVLPHPVFFYFDDKDRLTEVWLLKHTGRRGSDDFEAEEIEQARLPLRLVPPANASAAPSTNH